MFSKWIPGIPQELSLLGKQSTGSLTQKQLKFILLTIEAHLSQQLGEKIQPYISQSKSLLQKLQKPSAQQSSSSQVQSIDMDNSLQNQLLTTKQKYNELVNKLDIHNEHMKQILAHIVDLLVTLGEALENEDLLTPIQDFQTSFQNLNANKVQKTLKYFEKLFEAALDDFIQLKVKQIEKQLKDEMGVVKNYSKEIEGLYRKQKSKSQELEQKIKKMTSNFSELSEKLKILQLTSSEAALESYSRDLEKHKAQQSELTQRVKILQRDKQRAEKTNKQLQGQLRKNNSIIQTLKTNQSTIIEQMQAESIKKQKAFKNSIAKHYQQKTTYEQRIDALSNQISTLKAELTRLNEQNKELVQNNKGDNKQGSNKSIEIAQAESAEQINELKEEISNLEKNSVNRNILKELFLKYQDESKQWSIRKDIQNQIYLQLGIQVEKKDQADIGQVKGWFNKFF